MLSFMKNFINAFDLLTSPSCSVSVLFFSRKWKKKSQSSQDTKNGGLLGSATTSLNCSLFTLQTPQGAARGGSSLSDPHYVVISRLPLR